MICVHKLFVAPSRVRSVDLLPIITVNVRAGRPLYYIVKQPYSNLTYDPHWVPTQLSCDIRVLHIERIQATNVSASPERNCSTIETKGEYDFLEILRGILFPIRETTFLKPTYQKSCETKHI